MSGAELFEPELRTRIDQIRASAEEAWLALNPDLAPNLGEARRVVGKRQQVRSHINVFTVSERMVTKGSAQRATARAQVADVKRCRADVAQQGVEARGRAEQKGLHQRRDREVAEHCENAVRWIDGEIVGSAPGPIIAWEEANAGTHVAPLPIAEARLATAEADVAAATAELVAALDSWDRRFGVSDARNVEQPAVAEAS
jgi:hypothetical protein